MTSAGSGIDQSATSIQILPYAVACLTQTERVSDDVTRKIGPLDFIVISSDFDP